MYNIILSIGQGQRVCDAIFTQMFQCWAAIKNLHKTGVVSQAVASTPKPRKIK
jgi:hypothetical protein